MTEETARALDRVSVEIPGDGGLVRVGTVSAALIEPQCDAGDFFGAYLSFKRRSGRVVGIICQCASDARKLPGFEPVPDPLRQ